MTDFIKNNSELFIFLSVLLAVAILVVLCIVLAKSNRLVRSLLVNRFKFIDLNEKNAEDDEPLYTIIISNNSMNAVSVASIGFEHKGDYFNYRTECKRQLENQNADLVILPRGSVKLRLKQSELESAVFATAKTKKFGKLKIYLIGLGGESRIAATKVIGKKMAESYKTYYAYHEPVIIAAFIAACKDKKVKGIKLTLIEKIKLFFWSKRVASLESIKIAAIAENNEADASAEETRSAAPEVSSEKEAKAVLESATMEESMKHVFGEEKKQADTETVDAYADTTEEVAEESIEEEMLARKDEAADNND